jgi:hypothetical protein
MVRRAKHNQIRVPPLGQRQERVGGRALLDEDDLELPAVPLGDALREDARILAALVVLVTGDDLLVERLIRH